MSHQDPVQHHHGPHGHPDIMTEEMRRQLHETVEHIDHLHADKEKQLHENQRKLAEFFAALPQFAEAFTRDMNKSDYQTSVATSPKQHGIDHSATLTIKRHGTDFVRFGINGTASSTGSRIAGTVSFSNKAKNQEMGPLDEGIRQRISKVLIDALGEAGEVFNRI